MKSKKYQGMITQQNLMQQDVVEQYGNKTVTLNLYSLLIEGEKTHLIYKRDKNLPQDMVGKTISYYKTKNGYIYGSKVLKTINHTKDFTPEYSKTK